MTKCECKLNPYLIGWRNRFDCILCQEDSNLLAQDRGVPDSHRSLENAIELERLPGELNQVAESNCTCEPARRAGQREPRLQTLCKQLQRQNRRTCGGAAKGSRLDSTEGGAFWGILAELPGSQTGLARGAWGGTASPNRSLLAAGKMGHGREWGSRASHNAVPWTWEPEGKGNCSFFEKVGTTGPWTSGGTETKINIRFSSRPSSGGRSGAVLAVSWERANSNISGLPASGPFRRLPGRLGAWLGCGGRRSTARGSTRRPRCRFNVHIRAGQGKTRQGRHTGTPGSME